MPADNPLGEFTRDAAASLGFDQIRRPSEGAIDPNAAFDDEREYDQEDDQEDDDERDEDDAGEEDAAPAEADSDRYATEREFIEAILASGGAGA